MHDVENATWIGVLQLSQTKALVGTEEKVKERREITRTIDKNLDYGRLWGISSAFCCSSCR